MPGNIFLSERDRVFGPPDLKRRIILTDILPIDYTETLNGAEARARIIPPLFHFRFQRVPSFDYLSTKTLLAEETFPSRAGISVGTSSDWDTPYPRLG